MISLILASAVILVSTCWFLWYSRKAVFDRLPPGPRPWPFLESRQELRQTRQWEALDDLHRQYGPLVGMTWGGRPAVLIGKREIAKDLFGKRGSIYSSRARLVMGLDIMTGGDHVFFLPYGPKWKKLSRIQATFLNRPAVKHYRPLQELESLHTLQDLLHSDDYEACFSRFQASLTHALAYGTRLPSATDPQLTELENIARTFISAATNSHWMVDSFPILRYVPSCLAPWKRFGQQIHAQTVRLFQGKMAVAEQTRSWNWVKHIRALKHTSGVTDHEMVYVIGSIYQAGVGIITATLRLFIMACVLHPEAVKAAQDELDRVVGSDRLPTLNDLSHLPYVEAFVKEVLRWRPLVLAATHSVTQDDDYRGYRIPRHAVILSNQWAMDMDREVWDSPDQFRPDRWMSDMKRMPSAFGLGQRMCAGQYMAMESLLIMASRMLWAFTFEHAWEGGKRIEIDSWAFHEESLFLVPKPYRARIQPRDQHRLHVIQSAWQTAERDINPLLDQIGQEIHTASA
ncbi:hypothetical protein BDV24DRAFT_134773 [Aspergillus arachidicola]|uniref:Cytochrome P450 n=1 Tax=Aspergillus arachidicola TaxID=656916 RepID=A0A5N6Y3A8_9EURO|nr:hypothetical protein BDV24DRAFT_134773 [Aspergillus arachidicola]